MIYRVWQIVSCIWFLILFSRWFLPVHDVGSKFYKHCKKQQRTSQRLNVVPRQAPLFLWQNYHTTSLRLTTATPRILIHIIIYFWLHNDNIVFSWSFGGTVVRSWSFGRTFRSFGRTFQSFGRTFGRAPGTYHHHHVCGSGFSNSVNP